MVVLVDYTAAAALVQVRAEGAGSMERLESARKVSSSLHTHQKGVAEAPSQFLCTTINKWQNTKWYRY
jgi:hypothetical protein